MNCPLENAVKSQIWIAISIYVLVAVIKKRLNIDADLYTMLQILSLTSFERTPLNQLPPQIRYGSGLPVCYWDTKASSRSTAP